MCKVRVWYGNDIPVFVQCFFKLLFLKGKEKFHLLNIKLKCVAKEGYVRGYDLDMGKEIIILLNLQNTNKFCCKYISVNIKV